MAPEPAAPGPSTTAAPPAAPTPTDQDLLIITITSVGVDSRLAAMCGIPQTSVFFKYDSAKLSPEAKERLDQIASCATAGPAKGKRLAVVGYPDPTGSDSYNKQLGKSRATAVGDYLRSRGIHGHRVEIESRGEAVGPAPDPWAWPMFRRVTIRLAD
ncbi:MAG TPA: OmpA family protein [Kofleriaceae bacterium]|nr:OmpA family protein [Kofleriaceae bacterium]